MTHLALPLQPFRGASAYWLQFPARCLTLGIASFRAGWTAMHTTAMYLPDALSDVEQKSFVDLIHASLNYPGDVSEPDLPSARAA